MIEYAAVDGGPAVDAIEYTSFTSAIDLMAVHKRDIQGILVLAVSAAATMTVELPDQTANRVLTVAAGDYLPIRARSIVEVSNVTRVRVYWGRY